MTVGSLLAALPAVDWSHLAPILVLWGVAFVFFVLLLVLEARAARRARRLEERLPPAVVFELDEHRAARARAAARVDVRNGARW